MILLGKPREFQIPRNSLGIPSSKSGNPGIGTPMLLRSVRFVFVLLQRHRTVLKEASALYLYSYATLPIRAAQSLFLKEK